MSKLASRLLVFFIGVPLILAIVIAPFFNHLPLHVLICLIAGLAANELYDIFSLKFKLPSKIFIICNTVFVALVASAINVLPYFTGMHFSNGQELISYAYVIAITAILFVEVINTSEFEASIARIGLSAFIITYCGYLITFVSRLAQDKGYMDYTVPFVCVFLLMVFLCDSIAWFLGVLLGKNNRGIIKASPNKSIMGFIGGFIGSAGAGVIGILVWPEVFGESLVKMIFMGIMIALVSITGDLAESVIKRSAGVKDSGCLIPGRGGVLDSIDSIVVAAPVYYLLLEILFGPFA